MESPSEVLLCGHKAPHRGMYQKYNFEKVVFNRMSQFFPGITGASKKVSTSIIVILHKQANIYAILCGNPSSCFKCSASSVVNGCSCCAQSSSASSPVSKRSQAGSCFTTHFFKRTCAHPIRLLKISKYLPNTNFSTQTTAGEKRTLKDTNRSETAHSTL